MSKVKSELTTATVLAFERNLDISDAFFWQTDSNSEQQKPSPIAINEKSVRGTISNRIKNAISNDPAKLDAEIEKANLQTVDSASLDAANDTLVVKWTCKVLPFTGKPNVCNNQDYQAKVLEVVASYKKELGLRALAKRYAMNIANARWLWRNRVGAEFIQLTISNKSGSVKIQNARDISLNDFTADSSEIQTITKWIEQGLTGEAFTVLSIEARAIVGYGQEVYPSQELVLDTGKKKSKVLYQINNIAGMHSQKVSNAIRTIDTWYTDAEFPIAIEPYGAVTTLGKAFRQPKLKEDFYSLFDAWVLKGEQPSPENQHYVMGVLIRGGVFGASGKE